MEKAIEMGVQAMEDIRSGKLPLETASEMHKMYHRVIMNRYVAVKERRHGDLDGRLAAAKKAMSK